MSTKETAVNFTNQTHKQADGYYSFVQNDQIAIVHTVSHINSDDNESTDGNSRCDNWNKEQSEKQKGHSMQKDNSDHLGRRSNQERDSGHWDKGWAWMVAIGASFCNFIVFGSLKSSGIVLNEVVERFQYPPAYSIVIFLTIGSTMLCTPLSSHLTTRIKCRHLIMGGGWLIFIGLLIAALAVHIAMVYVGLGLFCGIGGGFVLPASYVIIYQYFKEKRSKGFALATLGMGLGGLALAPLLGFLFDVYGYTGALLLNAALFLHLQVAGALMRPPPIAQTHTEEEVSKNSSQESEAKNDTGQEKEIKKDRGREQEISQPCCVQPEIEDDEKTPLVVKLKQTSKLALLKNPTFLLYLLNVCTCLLPSTMTYLPAFGLEIGIPTSLSSWVLSVNGLGDIVGRILSGLFFDKVQYGRKRMYHSCAGIIAGLMVVSVGFVDKLSSLLIITFIHGYFEAIFSAQAKEIPFEFVPTANMANAIGMLLFSEYIGSILGPVMHGVIKAKFDTYGIGFTIGGSLFAFTSFLMLMDFVRVQCCTRSY